MAWIEFVPLLILISCKMQFAILSCIKCVSTCWTIERRRHIVLILSCYLLHMQICLNEMMIPFEINQIKWNKWEKKNRNINVTLTCRWNASGIVNVLAIQQNVFTTCVGIPLTIHEIGCPTYCVAVITRLHASKSAVVNRLCNRNIALSVVTSCNLK